MPTRETLEQLNSVCYNFRHNFGFMQYLAQHAVQTTLANTKGVAALLEMMETHVKNPIATTYGHNDSAITLEVTEDNIAKSQFNIIIDVTEEITETQCKNFCLEGFEEWSCLFSSNNAICFSKSLGVMADHIPECVKSLTRNIWFNLSLVNNKCLDIHIVSDSDDNPPPSLIVTRNTNNPDLYTFRYKFTVARDVDGHNAVVTKIFNFVENTLISEYRFEMRQVLDPTREDIRKAAEIVMGLYSSAFKSCENGLSVVLPSCNTQSPNRLDIQSCYERGKKYTVAIRASIWCRIGCDDYPPYTDEEWLRVFPTVNGKITSLRPYGTNYLAQQRCCNMFANIFIANINKIIPLLHHTSLDRDTLSVDIIHGSKEMSNFVKISVTGVFAI